jgi:hypothetical protein
MDSLTEALVFPDGRIYDVLEFEVLENWRPRIRYRCTLEVKRRDIEVVTICFSIRLYHLAFINNRLPAMTATDAAEFARRWVWDYFNENRQPWPRSRWMRPVIVEIK